MAIIKKFRIKSFKNLNPILKFEKVSFSFKKRPILDFLSDKDILKLINQRSKIYVKADYKINCDILNKFQIA